MEFRIVGYIGLLGAGYCPTRHNMKVITIFTVAALILIGLYYNLTPEKSHTVSSSSYYTVVLDCGSTGTRVNIYEWLRNTTNSHGLPIFLHSYPDNSTWSRHDACQYHCMQTEPGLDKFLHNFSGLSTALEPLLLWAENQIPTQKLKETRIFLLATAGIRRLPREDAEWVLENAASVLAKHVFIYRRSWVRVLSGKEEAYYGWIALNYKQGKLGRSLEVPTLGILDLGGSSLQVVMERRVSKHNDHFLDSKVGSSEHQLLAYSLPAFGLNAAFDRSVAMLSKDQLARNSGDGELKLRHPCLGTGFTQNYTCYGCEPNGTDLLKGSGELHDVQPLHIYLIGDPNLERCMAIAKAAVVHSNYSDWSQLSADMTCSVDFSSSNRIDLPNGMSSHSAIHFHALSGFVAVYNILNMESTANTTELLQRGQQLCSKSWTDIQRTLGTGYYMEQSCFRVMYVVSLLRDGLCALDDKDITIGPGDISWTLGAALVEGDSLADSLNLQKLKLVSCLLFLFTLGLWSVAIMYCCKVNITASVLKHITGRKGVAVGTSLPIYIYPKKQMN